MRVTSYEQHCELVVAESWLVVSTQRAVAATSQCTANASHLSL